MGRKFKIGEYCLVAWTYYDLSKHQIVKIKDNSCFIAQNNLPVYELDFGDTKSSSFENRFNECWLYKLGPCLAYLYEKTTKTEKE